MNINFSKFKKIDCDDKCTTLQHPSGHMVKIVHKGLSPENQSELDKLPMNKAKGGMTGSKPSKPADSSNTMPGSPTEAKDAFTEPDDGGTDAVLASLQKESPPFGALGTTEKQHLPPCINPSCKSYGKPHPNCRCYGYGRGPEMGKFAEGGKVEDFCSKDNAHHPDCQYFKDKGLVEPTDSEKLEMAAQEASKGSAPVTESNPVQLPELSATPGAKEELSQGVSPNPEMQNNPPVPEATAPAPEPNIEGEEQAADQAAGPTPLETAQNTTAALHDESQKVQQDLNMGHIQPQTYQDLYNKKDTLGKVGTIFGLLMSGMGSGLSGQSNALLDMMNKTIENDLKAQESSATNRQNFLKIAQQSLKNQAEVTGININNKASERALEWSYAARTTLHDLTQKAMSLPEGSQARQNAMQSLAIMSQGIDKKEADMFSQAGLAQAIQESAFAGQGNTGIMKSGLMGEPLKEMGQDIETKRIPGVPGLASRPIPEHHRDQVQAMNVLDNKASDLISYAKAHEGTWNPKTRAVAAQKAEEMINFYNNSIQGGVLTEGRLKWLDDQIKKNPTSIIAQELSGNNARLQEIQSSNNMRKNMLLQSLGFKVSGPKTSGSQSGVQMKDGKPYKLDPTGKFMVPVK